MIYTRFIHDNINYLKNKNKIAVAVSGGSDSMSLCALLNQYTKEYGGELHCITVDHGLRQESKEEAQNIHSYLKSLNIIHVILTWEGEKPTSNIQEIARNARYSLLTDYCHKHKIELLTTGHQKNDQAENFILRAEHGSGLYGLAGIPKIGIFNNIEILRPLLGFDKNELQNHLTELNIKWIDDPSNQNEKFARVKIRKILGQYPEWINKLANISENLYRAKECIEYSLNKAIKDLTNIEKNQITIRLNDFNDLPQELKFRMLIKLLSYISYNQKPPRGERIERLITKIQNGSNFKAATLAGCLISRKKDKIIISHENETSA